MGVVEKSVSLYCLRETRLQYLIDSTHSCYSLFDFVNLVEWPHAALDVSQEVRFWIGSVLTQGSMQGNPGGYKRSRNHSSPVRFRPNGGR